MNVQLARGCSADQNEGGECSRAVRNAYGNPLRQVPPNADEVGDVRLENSSVVKNFKPLSTKTGFSIVSKITQCQGA